MDNGLQIDLKRAYKALKTPLEGEELALNGIRTILRENLKAQVERAVECVRSLQDPEWGPVRVLSGAQYGTDLFYWEGTPFTGVREVEGNHNFGQHPPKWYWRTPATGPKEKHIFKDPIECLIDLIKHLEEIQRARLDP